MVYKSHHPAAMAYTRQLNLEHEVSGKYIIGALQKAAPRLRLEYAEERHHGMLAVGLSSMHPNRHVAVMTGEKMELDVRWGRMYPKIALGYYLFSGRQYSEKIKEGEVKRNIDRVAGELEKILNSGK